MSHTGHGRRLCQYGGYHGQCRCPNTDNSEVFYPCDTEAEHAAAQAALGVPDRVAPPVVLAEELRRLLNITSRDNTSNTPDYVLAEFMLAALTAFEAGIKERDRWYGIAPTPGGTKDFNLAAETHGL